MIISPITFLFSFNLLHCCCSFSHSPNLFPITLPTTLTITFSSLFNYSHLLRSFSKTSPSCSRSTPPATITLSIARYFNSHSFVLYFFQALSCLLISLSLAHHSTLLPTSLVMTTPLLLLSHPLILSPHPLTLSLSHFLTLPLF